MVNTQSYQNTKEKHFKQSVKQVKISLFGHEFVIIKGQKEAKEPEMDKRGDEIGKLAGDQILEGLRGQD